MDIEKEHQDVMTAQEILSELRKLADSERSENEPNSENDASMLDDAIASLEKFVAAEEKEGTPNKFESPVSKSEGLVDTSVLTGPIGGLKNFLIKKSQDNQAQ